MKRGHFIASWKSRYFTIEGGLFTYWRNELEYIENDKPRGCMFIQSLGEFAQKDNLGFKVICKWFTNTTEKTEYYFRALSPIDKEKAIEAFEKGMQKYQSLCRQAGGEGFNEEVSSVLT